MSGAAMGRGPLVTLAALSLCAIVFIAVSAPSLPPVVATHYAAGGRPNGWMSREGYTLFAIAFAVVLPWLLFAAIALAPARWPAFANLHDRDHWVEPARRERTLSLLRRFGTGVAAAMIVLAAAVHGAILAAHRRHPPQLDEGPFFAIVALFVVAIGIAVLGLRRQFKQSRA